MEPPTIAREAPVLEGERTILARIAVDAKRLVGLVAVALNAVVLALLAVAAFAWVKWDRVDDVIPWSLCVVYVLVNMLATYRGEPDPDRDVRA